MNNTHPHNNAATTIAPVHARSTRQVTLDGNEAAASVAHRLSEVIAIYPITPSSTMGELCDEWSAKGQTNLWGTVPDVVQMQSEAGVAGAVHGALQAGTLSTTFTASQGLLLMIPNMYKIAGELTPFCLHVTARTLATHALSIFGDHQDVMSCRMTGFAMLASASVQEAHDLALIAHAATLQSRVPFMHFFDGFRTSHEIAKVYELSDDDLRHMIDEQWIQDHRARALTPDRPMLRGTAQNPDTFFQARESCNTFYDDTPSIVKSTMKRFAELTGRQYGLFDYVGDPDAQRIVVLMGSATQTAEETVQWLGERGEKVGIVKVRLYRPWDAEAFIRALPKSTRAIAVLDRTKEPGALGEPLYLDVAATLASASRHGWDGAIPRIIGGRYGLSSKEFTPSMLKGVFDELKKPDPKPIFTIGINDDVTGLSLDHDPKLDIEPDDVFRAVFFGLGADGTVGANKNSIKIIGEETTHHAQGYFVYDSKKSGAITISHLRFGPRPIQSAYLIHQAHFVACHQFHFLERHDVLRYAAPGAVFLLNTTHDKDHVWDKLPAEVQRTILDKKLRFHVIDAYKVATDTNMGRRINTIMQTCFFGISGVLPREQAIAHIKQSIVKTYGRKGEQIVKKNFAAVDHALSHLQEVDYSSRTLGAQSAPPVVADHAPDFVQRITAMMLGGQGDLLPVSAFPVDGTYPMSTARWEKRNIAMEIPAWEPSLCIQCNKCVMICPHAAIRAKVYDPAALNGAPDSFLSMDYKAPDLRGQKYSLQVAPEDCTGCNLCVNVCPAIDKTNPSHKAINMTEQAPIRDAEKRNFEFFLNLPEPDRSRLRLDVKGSQFLRPLFEFSGACAGCGETPYIRLITQLFGDRLLIANATGCSSIYGGNLPTTPYCTDDSGRGPAWSNSLFEDNAEFGLGMRLAADKQEQMAREYLTRLSGDIDPALVDALLGADQSNDSGITEQRKRVAELKRILSVLPGEESRRLLSLCDYLVKKSVWIVGGDGWAYDIGFGGLDHVLASGHKVNVLVLDTEVYSNTGGQQSKSTPMGAAAKFAVAGKASPKKDLAMIAMTYGNIYVAKVAMGAKDVQTVKAIQEAEAYPGPSLIIAYSHCIAHGYDMAHGAQQQKLAVETGYWPIYRYDPRRLAQGQSPLQLDSAAPKTPVGDYMRNETRFRVVEQQDPERFRMLMEQAQLNIAQKFALYEHLSKLDVTQPDKE